MEFNAAFGKMILIIVLSLVIPIALTSFNAMNVTGFTTTQMAIINIMGFIVPFMFLNMLMKE